MFHRIQQYDPIELGGRWYRPRAYADAQPDGTWDGWLVFFPIRGGPAIAASEPETWQSSLDALATWAAGVTPVYLEGAGVRALRVAAESPVLARLTEAEYEALEDAEQLEAAADLDRASADLDEAAASAARADAEAIRRERAATEGALAAAEEASARMVADLHEREADEARVVAADAAARKRAAKAAAKPRKRTTRRNSK